MGQKRNRMHSAKRRKLCSQVRPARNGKLHDQIELAARNISGFFRVKAAVLPYDLANRLVCLLVILRADHEDHRGSSKRNDVQDQNCDRDHNGKNDRDLRQTRTADNTHTDSPVQKDQIHRLLDGGPETDDRQRADHTEGDHDTGLDRQNDRRCDQRHAHERDIEVFGVEGAPGKESVAEKDINTKHQRKAQGYDDSLGSQLNG